MLFLLLKPKFLSLKNSLNARNVMKRLPFIIIGIGVWILFYIATYKVLSYVRAIEIFGEMLSKKMFSMTFLSLTGFLILSNIITAISLFYLSRDTAFLLSKPVETKDIIRLKSFETILNSSWMALSFVPPVFIAYGISYHASSVYYVFIFAAFFLLILITAGIGISIAHILTRLFPAKNIRNVFLAAGLMLFLIIYFIVKSVIPHNLDTSDDFISSMMSFKTDSFFLPSYWITEALTPIFKQRGPDIFYALVIFINSAFFLLLSYIVGKKFYRENIERIQPSPKNIRGFCRGFYPSLNTALFYKDLKIFFRDTGQWSQIFIISALVIVYVYNFKSIPVDTISGLLPFIKELIALVNLVMAGLVLSSVAARFIYTSVSLEGQAFWIIKASPVDISRFLWSKFVTGFAPVTILILLLVFLTNSAMNINGHLMLASLGTILMLCISVSSLGTGFGAIYPKFNYENIASVSMSLGGMAFMLTAFSVVLVTLTLESLIFYIYHHSAGTGAGLNASEKIRIAVFSILILILNGSAFYLPMKFGKKKISEHVLS